MALCSVLASLLVTVFITTRIRQYGAHMPVYARGAQLSCCFVRQLQCCNFHKL